MVDGDFVELPAGDDFGVVAIPIGVPHRDVQRLGHVVIIASAKLLLKVQGRLLRPRGHRGVQYPRGETWLQHLCFEPGGHVHAGHLFEGFFELGGIHVAVVQFGNDRLHA